MDRNLSDEQLDRIAARLAADFSADDATVDAIADSPRLWWNVRSAIEAGRERRERGWFGFTLPRFLTVSAGAALVVAAFAVLIAANFLRDPQLGVSNPVADAPQVVGVDDPAATVAVLTPVLPPTSNPAAAESATTPVTARSRRPDSTNFQQSQAPARPVARPKAPTPSPRTAFPTSDAAVAKAETRTDFIPLSYAANAEGGQIVRVKVPSSMMVSLGVVNHVESDSELVAAEVVLGDDGLARAIRFIR